MNTKFSLEYPRGTNHEEGNITMDLREGVDWIHLFQDRGRWRYDNYCYSLIYPLARAYTHEANMADTRIAVMTGRNVIRRTHLQLPRCKDP